MYGALKQLIIPVGILAVLASMLLPLPALLLDFLLVGNLLLALVLLVSALYLSEPLKLSSLPTILLLATLYRLALNISTTRMILGSGEIAKTVEAFGSVVIQGSLVVGLVVFLVITLVQFIVVAKGAERVAEVAARFTLDALPGKQMSIDADVRAGLIDFETARIKRQELQTESRFYGALDGAMKFVKGDAIAGLVIAAINIAGGFGVGILMEGLDIASACTKYTILTIGDGLLAQIPSLLNSLAAGLVVTRVGRGDDSPLATEIPTQLGRMKSVRLIVGSVALIMAFLPGLPTLPFMVLAIFLLVSVLVAKPEKEDNPPQQESLFQPKPPAVLQIEISEQLAPRLVSATDFSRCLDSCRQQIFERWGLIIAMPELISSKLTEPLVRIRMRGLPVFSETITNQQQNINSLITDRIIEIVSERATEFVDDILTRRTLDFFDRQAPELVSAVVPELATVTQITTILRNLIKEEISIKNFDLIMQAIAEAGQRVQGERFLVQEVRVALRRTICEKYSSPDGVLNCIALDPVLDMALSRAECNNQLIDPQQINPVVEFLRSHSFNDIVLVVSKTARALLRDCLELHHFTIPVIAHEEIAEEVKLNLITEITVSNSEVSENILEQLAA